MLVKCLYRQGGTLASRSRGWEIVVALTRGPASAAAVMRCRENGAVTDVPLGILPRGPDHGRDIHAAEARVRGTAPSKV